MTQNAIQRVNRLYPTMPIQISKAWIEMIHRYAACILGLFILVLGILSIQRKLNCADFFDGISDFSSNSGYVDGYHKIIANYSISTFTWGFYYFGFALVVSFKSNNYFHRRP